ncbi:MAG: bifunctional (p)ppGpp synthetase/guanosine-3',5'-bis(diphosphate) 3'-pyrophosphohydrolase [Clostridium sp.]|nr:bifunctional (p)ppGpp synthetase/guanosine-3',5'-bis(diphosphate) 3'-pyrophosphohydrolase [Clostridium sp.]
MSDKLIDDLISCIKENKLNVDLDLINKAYNFAKVKHGNQTRKSGEPYIIHPIAVAKILVEMGMDTSTIVAGLLHDVLEDTSCTFETMEKEFNLEIAKLVDGVTKLTKFQYKSKEEQQADNVRKMLVAMAEDIRVIIIKLADRLHNLRTLEYMTKEKQMQKAKETLDIYAPLAHRLGMSKIKWELEDLSFRYLHEKEYYDLVNAIAEKRTEREAYTKKVVNELSDKLQEAGINAEIDGRPKHFYSIYRKMIKKNKTLDQIFDLIAVRVLVNSVKDCYGVLGIVHTIFKPIPGRFKDYIAMPKPNMYQSLHTTVLGKGGKPFEIQIRTFDMHKTAEYGIAAHWKYKEGDNNKESEFDKKLVWVREMLEWQKNTSDAHEFIEDFKKDLISDEVYVFTPKGVVINLPGGGTPIDFAYRIHTDVGNKCVMAKVNGKVVPLDYKLKTGEIVEIITSNNSKGPSMNWLNYAKSNQAKSKIKAWFKKANREENITKGKEILEKELKKYSVSFNDIAKGEAYEKLQKKYNFHTTEELYAGLGSGIIPILTFISKLREEKVAEKPSDEEIVKAIEEKNEKNQEKEEIKTKSGIIIKGENNLLYRLARCCTPVPGDDVLGYITKGRGVSIHRKDCINLISLIKHDPEKVVDVSWGEKEAKSSYVAEIKVKTDDSVGLISDVSKTISDCGLNIVALNASSQSANKAMMTVKVEIKAIEQLKELMKKIRKIKGVTEVFRMNN